MLATTLKLVSLLVYPLNLSLLVAVIGLVVWRLGWVRSGFFAVVLAVAWLYVSSTAQFSYYLMGKLEQQFPAPALDEIEQVDAIVLLGGGMRGDSRSGTLPDLNQYADRLVHAVYLHNAGKADYILLTGGSAAGARSEARLMADILTVMGVSPESLILEEQSRNTRDNAVNSAQILRERDMHRILLVTSAFHMPRAFTLFDREGLEVMAAPTDFSRVIIKSTLPGGIPGVKNLYRTTLALHEIVGYQVYRLRGWL